MKTNIEDFKSKHQPIGLSMELKSDGESAYEKHLIGGHTKLYTENQIEEYLESVSEEFDELKRQLEIEIKTTKSWQKSYHSLFNRKANEIKALKNQVQLLINMGSEEVKRIQSFKKPVVPQFVADWYEFNKADLDFGIFLECANAPKKPTTEFQRWFNNSAISPITTLISMRNGYEVEKEKHFYLKHIDMSKRDEDKWWFLGGKDRLGHGGREKGTLPMTDYYKFTQSEIDKMETGSYEKIPVQEDTE